MLAVSDIEGEPRILDTDLAKALGMARPTNIRVTIEACRPSLESFGHVARRECNVPMPPRGTKSVDAFYLNEEQAVYVTMHARTDRAEAVRRNRTMRMILGALLLTLANSAVAAPVCGGRIDSEGVLVVGRSETRCPWPFTVDDIVLVCKPTRFGEAAYVVAKGKAFALNGSAKTAGPLSPFPKLSDMREIAESDFATMPWIKPARELCADE